MTSFHSPEPMSQFAGRSGSLCLGTLGSLVSIWARRTLTWKLIPELSLQRTRGAAEVKLQSLGPGSESCQVLIAERWWAGILSLHSTWPHEDPVVRRGYLGRVTQLAHFVFMNLYKRPPPETSVSFSAHFGGSSWRLGRGPLAKHLAQG